LPASHEQSGPDAEPDTGMSNRQGSALPKKLLSRTDGIMLICGMVIGAGIFKTPSIVAANSSNTLQFMLVWVLGGAVSLCGALVYAELSSRYPETGGEYAFLSRGLGRGAAFVFAWSRMTVIQTGVIAAVAFVFGDYASEILRLGPKSSAIYAALAVVAMTALNLVGTPESKTLQRVMQVLLFGGLLSLTAAGFSVRTSASAASPVTGSFGFAMVLVLLTYGGWNEAAYLGGEVRDASRNMVRILLGGILAITVLYLLVNAAYVAALGLDGVRQSQAVAADVMRKVAGNNGAVALALMVCTAALTTTNAAIFTGARTTWALGRDFPVLRRLGSWREAGSTPANALLLQGVITLALVAAGSLTPDGFSAMVAYTSPVFWTFFLLTAVTLFRFRMQRDPAHDGLFRVPLYPLTPIAFCLACAYMLYSSIDYVRVAVEFGVPVFGGLAAMIAGIPLYFWANRER
jgi:APA family basic amino acid/polyamine antiporter